ncbi:Rad2 nuclease [Coemansia sp. RSA 1721]|nr:Rad2 nuclease [Coemansia sp. RSA 1721]
MGISGLLPLLRETQRSGHIEEFSGQTVGVDSYIWLYKGAFGCSTELALNKPTTKYITFFMNRARMLRHYGIRPYFVFDGGPLPSKRHTEMARKQSRMEKREQGIKFWNQGKKKQAFEQFTRSIEVTPEMAKEVIKELEKEGFDYVVAPFEADAQLAYLESKGLISAAISEDSDLIVFGCKNIIFKLDQYGQATIFDQKLMDQVRAVDVSGWSQQKLRHMCILSGCDYIASVPGVGLKKAYRYVARSPSLLLAVELMRVDRLQVPDDYEEQVTRAELTFMYQRVYDPVNKRLDHVGMLGNDAPDTKQMLFLGDMHEPKVAQDIAMGRIDPITLIPFGQELVQTTDLVSTNDTAVTTAAVCSDSPRVSNQSSVSVKPTKGFSMGSAQKQKQQQQQSAKQTAVPVARAKSLLSFWAKPKQNTPTAAATTSLRPRASVSGDSNIVTVASTESVADEDEVRVKFRAKDTTTSSLVKTSQQSRFFGQTAHQSESPSKANSSSSSSLSALSTPTISTRSQTSQSSVIWPNTPAELVILSQDSVSFTPTQNDPDTTQSQQQQQILISQDILATSTLVSRKGSLPKDESATSLSATESQTLDGNNSCCKHPTCPKQPSLRATPVSKLGKRLSGDRFIMDTPPSLVNSPDYAKRKLDSFVDSVKKFRFTTQQQQQPVASPNRGITALRRRLEAKVDDIIDSSDSEKENTVYVA